MLLGEGPEIRRRHGEARLGRRGRKRTPAEKRHGLRDKGLGHDLGRRDHDRRHRPSGCERRGHGLFPFVQELPEADAVRDVDPERRACRRPLAVAHGTGQVDGCAPLEDIPAGPIWPWRKASVGRSVRVRLFPAGALDLVPGVGPDRRQDVEATAGGEPRLEHRVCEPAGQSRACRAKVAIEVVQPDDDLASGQDVIDLRQAELRVGIGHDHRGVAEQLLGDLGERPRLAGERRPAEDDERLLLEQGADVVVLVARDVRGECLRACASQRRDVQDGGRRVGDGTLPADRLDRRSVAAVVVRDPDAIVDDARGETACAGLDVVGGYVSRRCLLARLRLGAHRISRAWAC